MKDIYNIFWTGGLDSTCRVCELSLQNCIIQPYYLVDSGRLSNIVEQQRMNEILKILRESSQTKAEIRNIIKINMDSIPENASITKSYNNLQKKYTLGSQYDWLARFAYSQNIFIELSCEYMIEGGLFRVLHSETKLVLTDTPCPCLKLDLQNSSEDAINVFGNCLFPYSIWNLTKKEEVEWLRKNNFFNIASLTWFCHDPIFGLPCGNCHPCKQTIKEGLGWRVPKRGMFWGTLRKYAIRIPQKIFKKLFCKHV